MAPNEVWATTDDGHRLAKEDGYRPRQTYSAFSLLFHAAFRDKTAEGTVNRDKLEGRKVFPAPDSVKNVVGFWFAQIVDFTDHMAVKNDQAPNVFMFQHVTTPAGLTLSGYTILGGGQSETRAPGIYLNQELTVDSGLQLHLTVIEELAHWVSGNSDLTRGFQEFLTRWIYHATAPAIEIVTGHPAPAK